MALPVPYFSIHALACFLILLILPSCKKEKGGIDSYLITTGVEHDLTALAKGNGDTLFLSGSRNHSGVILRSCDAGITWQAMALFDYGINDVCFNSGYIYAAADSFNLFRSADAGRTWEEIWLINGPSLEYQSHLKSVQCTGAAIMFCGGWNFGKGVIGISNDNGVNWKYVTSEHELRTLIISDSLHAFCSGYGELLCTSDGGTTWTQMNAKDKFWISSTHAGDKTYICSFDAAVLSTADAGSTWYFKDKEKKLFSNGYMCISGNGPDVFVAGMNGRGYYSINAGSEWNAVSGFDDSNIYDVLMMGQAKGFAAGEQGKLYYFTVSIE